MQLLSFAAAAAAALYVVDATQDFEAFLSSSFGQNMIPDATESIAEYYNDLSTLVSNLYDLNVILPFQRLEDEFVYQP